MPRTKTKKQQWGGGRRPRKGPKTTPIHDRAVKCPVCDHPFVVLIEAAKGGYNTKEAAQFLGMSVPTLHRQVQRGLLRPSRGIRLLSFSEEEMRRYLRDTMSQ